MYIKKFIGLFIIISATAIASFAQAGSRSAWHSPEGSWEGVVTNLEGGPAPFRVLMTFTAGGGFIGTGDGDNAVGSPQHGVWERIGGASSRTYAVTFRQLFYMSDASPTGTARIRQTVLLNKAGDSWSGPFTIEILDADGIVVFIGSGTSTATRIVPEP